jgi:hypothetical protein
VYATKCPPVGDKRRGEGGKEGRKEGGKEGKKGAEGGKRGREKEGKVIFTRCHEHRGPSYTEPLPPSLPPSLAPPSLSPSSPPSQGEIISPEEEEESDDQKGVGQDNSIEGPDIEKRREGVREGGREGGRAAREEEQDGRRDLIEGGRIKRLSCNEAFSFHTHHSFTSRVF